MMGIKKRGKKNRKVIVTGSKARRVQQGTRASSEALTLRTFRVEDLSIAALKPHPRNPRTHSRKQLRQIAESIRTFGFTNPVLVDGQDRIIAGHGRVEAAKLLGMERVPTIRIKDMTEAQIRAYILADNKLAENAGWDRELLALELQYIAELEVDFDLTVTGFEMAEIDLLFEGPVIEEDLAANKVPDIDPAEPPVSRLGDIWRLGPHRLLCGDATEKIPFDRLMDRKKAQMVFTDPPYNVPIDGHVCGLGSIKHPEFVMASGEMSEEEFTAFLRTVLDNLAVHSTDGSIHFIFMDWRHISELLTAARSVYSELKNLCVWNKDNAGMGTFYRSKHELVFAFKNGTKAHVNNFELGQHGRYRTNVWDHPGVNSLREGRMEELHMHPTVKPVALVADAIQDCSKRGSVVLDCFAGSGTILIAAEKTGRRAYAMELELKYVDAAVRRWEAYTGGEATHEETGCSFTKLEEVRSSET